MPSLKEIRSRIKSVQTTQQTTKAMKMVAASKLRRAQDLVIQLRPYANKLSDMMQNLSASAEVNSPYLVPRKANSVLLVIITSNRGLCGAFNSSIIRLASQVIEEQYAEHKKQGTLKLLCLGRKAYETFSKLGYDIISPNFDVFSHLSYDRASEYSNTILQGFLEEKWDRVDLVYNYFKNVATQIRMHEQFLPVKINPPTVQAAANNYIFEPSQEQIIYNLIPIILNTQFYKAILDSNAAEQGARMVAMDKATENAQDLLKELHLMFNKARQATITKEILEIVGGAEALASGA